MLLFYYVLLFLWGISFRSACVAGFRGNMKRPKKAHPSSTYNIFHYQTDNEVGNYPPSRYLYDKHSESRCGMRCPKDKIVVARRGADSVLMEKPLFGFCEANSRNKRSEKVEAHILVGPKVGDIIKAGTYTIILNLIHTRRPFHVKTCEYNYTVIVKTCRALHVRKHVTVKCTDVNKWGSMCSFSCSPGFKLVGPKRTKCMSSGRWRKHAPYCKRKYWEADCKVPDFDGLLNCNTDVSLESDLVSEGTVCTFECDEGFEIPTEVRYLSVVKCEGGQWNTSQDPTCTPIMSSALVTTPMNDVIIV